MQIVKTKDLDDSAAMGRLEKYIREAPENSRVFTITPAMAEDILERFNLKNRPRKPGKISEYAEHMTAQTWGLTGDTLKFSDKQRLRDGQNRLMACVRAGVPFTTHVVFGIADDLFDLMDRGRNRDGADILAIAGYQNATRMAAAVRWAYLIDEGRAKHRSSLEPTMVLRLLKDRYAGIEVWVQVAARIYSSTGQPIGMTAALLNAFNRANPTAAADFAAAWENGNFSGKFASIGKMQKRIASLMAASSGRIHEVVRAALIITAWNVYREGRQGTQTDFDWNPSKPFPTIAR